ncbi:protein-disulfide reductase DsbD [Methylococcus sp. EFPC2]|uniref:protein-disulfide reductase DsbD n=1 Tax=Methylococcus sp. EFPC2 TaxID=2812648 RepID=UPI001968A171|nr:protein-disulfide reductase DsbD [Methylococcus sp. EFPC2]QSA96992.1 protein-disulfide reductase DsbD [Methylococcus sp. EFPC2]
MREKPARLQGLDPQALETGGLLRYAGLLILFFTLFAPQANAEGLTPLPPEQIFPLTSRVLSADSVLLSWDIAKDHHLYRKKFKFASKTAGVTVGPVELPAGAMMHEENFGDMEVYRGHLELTLPLKRTDPAIREAELEVTVQGCADAGLCYPPYKRLLKLALPAMDGDSPLPLGEGRVRESGKAVASGFQEKSGDAALTPNPLPKGEGAKADPLAKFTRSLKSLIPGANQDDLLPADQAFHFIGEVKDAHTLHVSWQIADGYYLYRDRFRFTLIGATGVELGEPVIPHGETKVEDQGPAEVFHREIGFDLPLKRTSAGPLSLRLQARFQGCAEKGVCYPPMEKIAELNVPAADGSAPITAAPSLPTSTRGEPPPAAEQDRIADALKSDSAALTAATFFGFGLLMAFSPCIFPMIPILSGIIVGHGHKLTTGRAFALSLAYVLAAALAYTAFGVLAGLFGGNLQAAFQTPWIIILFSLVFVLLALSMFGFYELQMPAYIQERVAALSHQQKGGTLLGAAIMGALSALIVGPCMAAPLAGALIYIGQTGNALLGGLALFSLGLGMGVPLLVVGASAGKLLPRAGIWMNAVKSAFGVAMLGVAVWLIQRIVPGPLAMALWALLLIVPAIYLNALDALPQPASGWRKLWKGVGVAMLAYGVLLLIGAAANGRDPLQPLRGVALAGTGEAVEGVEFRKIHTPAELQQQLDAAKAQGRWLMLDYYADWCVSCVEMERYTFTNPKVRAELSKFVLVQADVTGNEADEQALLQRYGLVGPPATLFFAPDGQERKEFRLIGFTEAVSFLTHLQRVLR